MESLGEWRTSGVLLHQPLVKRAIPEKLVPQSEFNLPKVVSNFFQLPQPWAQGSLYIGYCSTSIH